MRPLIFVVGQQLLYSPDHEEMHMIPYRDIDNDSGVAAYEVGPDFIRIAFKGSGRPYLYSYASAGQSNVETMKRLAASGDGLNAFINQHVKDDYVR